VCARARSASAATITGTIFFSDQEFTQTPFFNTWRLLNNKAYAILQQDNTTGHIASNFEQLPLNMVSKNLI
jgi:hypothetical protein